MATRQYGPRNAPGVSVIQRDNDKLVTPGALGTAVFVGVTEKGDETSLIHCPNKAAYERLCGSLQRDHYLADSAFDYFFHADGNGQLYIARVTTGDEVKSTLTLKDRRASRQDILKFEAKNGGHWGGKYKTEFNEFSATVSIGSETTLIDTDKTWAVNEWKGATLYTSKTSTVTSYTVLSNTATTLTLTGDSTLQADWTTDPDYYHFVKENGDKHLAVELVPSGVEDPSTEFGLVIYLDGREVRRYDNLSLDAEARYFIERVVNDDGLNEYITVTSLLGSSAATSATKPANLYLKPVTAGGDKLTFNILQTIDGLTAAAVPKLERPVVGSKCVPHTITATWDDTAAKFVITYSTPFADVGDVFSETTIIATTDPVSGYKLYDVVAPTEFADYTLSSFTIHANVLVADDGKTFKIEVMPLVVDEAIDGKLYPDITNDRRSSFVISDNDVNSITVKGTSDITTSLTTAPVGAMHTGSVDAGTVDISTKTLSLHVNNSAVQTFVAPASTDTIAETIAWINNVFTGVVATIATGDKVVLTTSETGSYAKLTVLDAGVGEVDELLGFTEGNYYGADGDVAQASWAQELSGAYEDYSYLADSDFTTRILDKEVSPINTLSQANVGLVKIACPGIDSTAVMKAGLAYAESKSYEFFVSTPSSKVTEIDVDTHITDTIGKSDFGIADFPSYGDVANPFGAGFVERPLVGMIFGRDALFAATYKGYHRPAAGIYATLPLVVKLPTDVLGRDLDEEYLYPRGINVIKRGKGNYFINGARTMAVDPAWKYKGIRELVSHYTRFFLENFDFIIFESNHASKRDLLFAALVAYFDQEVKNGVLSPPIGEPDSEAYIVKVDAGNNSELDRQEGRLNVEVIIRGTPIIENLVFSISQAGVNVSLRAV